MNPKEYLSSATAKEVKGGYYHRDRSTTDQHRPPLYKDRRCVAKKALRKRTGMAICLTKQGCALSAYCVGEIRVCCIGNYFHVPITRRGINSTSSEKFSFRNCRYF